MTTPPIPQRPPRRRLVAVVYRVLEVAVYVVTYGVLAVLLYALIRSFF